MRHVLLLKYAYIKHTLLLSHCYVLSACSVIPQGSLSDKKVCGLAGFCLKRVRLLQKRKGWERKRLVSYNHVQITKTLHAFENYPGLRWDTHIYTYIYVYIFRTSEFSISLSTDLIQNFSGIIYFKKILSSWNKCLN